MNPCIKSLVLFSSILIALNGCGDGSSSSNSAPAHPTLADGTYAKIVSINGDENPAHEQELNVKPGDIVRVSADVLTANSGNYKFEGKKAEDFDWSASDRGDDVCNSSIESGCLEKSNFEFTDYGVNYYVPYSIAGSITLHVQSAGNAAMSDTLTLRNSLYSNGYVAPTSVITSADDYHYKVFDSSLALAGQGRWVTFSDRRYWVPYVSDADWQPYQNGYWTSVEGDGYTWISNDPWGWYTDHYGVWRHHETYGWVWEEFGDAKYRPAAVSWMDDDAYVGWYPYYDGYRAAYRAEDATIGFDDGFWFGLSLGASFGGAHFTAGFTFVRFSDFASENIFNVRIADRETCNQYFLRDYSTGHVRVSLGVDLSRHGVNLLKTKVDAKNFGGRGVRVPAPVHEVPAELRSHAIANDERISRPIPVGAVVSHDGNGHVSYSTPHATGNGHGVGAPARPPHGNGHRR